jgi:hypothetical protein
MTLKDTHTHTHTLGLTPPDEGSARSRDLYLTNTQHSQQTDIHAYNGIRKRSPSKWTAVDPTPRLRCHRDRLTTTRVVIIVDDEISVFVRVSWDLTQSETTVQTQHFPSPNWHRTTNVVSDRWLRNFLSLKNKQEVSAEKACLRITSACVVHYFIIKQKGYCCVTKCVCELFDEAVSCWDYETSGMTWIWYFSTRSHSRTKDWISQQVTQRGKLQVKL